MTRLIGALLLAALPLLALAQPAPPDLRQLPPAAEASAPAEAASEPLKRRCVAGCDGQSARVTWNEDASNRFEEHRDNTGRLVKLFVHPKNGAPKYEILVNSGRGAQHITTSINRGLVHNVTQQAPSAQTNQSVWEIKKF